MAALPPGWKIEIVNGPTQPQPELELAFDTEPIVGWRAWKLVDYSRRDGTTEPRLTAIIAGEIWDPRRRFEARCTRSRSHSHESPWPDCQCGAWAVRTRTDAAQRALAAGGKTVCYGPVYLWGRVLEFEHGYRAQYAYPQKLYLQDAPDGLAPALQQIYGVPVTRLAAPARRVVQATFSIDSSGFTSAIAQFSQAITAMSITTREAATKVGASADLVVADQARDPVLPKARKQRPPRSRPTFLDALRQKKKPR